MVTNTRLLQFRDIRDPRNPDFYGHLTPVSAGKEIPFDIRRVYYIYGVDAAAERGFHSHRALEQVLICLSGSVRIRVKTPFQEEVVLLDQGHIGLYIGPYVWREMFDFSEHAALLVLASQDYDEHDYYRTYQEYEADARAYFTQKTEEL
ncbi:MAG: FdtA/QdtA family cupin domain-containing protein [Candidatus Limiplasma sp.]|nr:FdtA/QdtA family cupin domain-containing protein [Candidatus Limiplasma sp.]